MRCPLLPLWWSSDHSFWPFNTGNKFIPRVFFFLCRCKVKYAIKVPCPVQFILYSVDFGLHSLHGYLQYSDALWWLCSWMHRKCFIGSFSCRGSVPSTAVAPCSRCFMGQLWPICSILSWANISKQESYGDLKGNPERFVYIQTGNWCLMAYFVCNSAWYMLLMEILQQHITTLLWPWIVSTCRNI